MLTLIIILALAVVCVVSLGVVTFGRFARDRRVAMARLSTGGQIIRTRCGLVEYVVVGDSGPVVLLLHGGLGGWDQGVAFGVDLLSRQGSNPDYRQALDGGAALLAEPFRLVVPSRVGYLRTPLDTGRTPAQGADAGAALLDELGIDEVAVVGVSGGGPTALQFALRYPQRTRRLAMVCAIAKHHVQPGRTCKSVVGLFVFSRLGRWVFDFFSWFMHGIAMRYPTWMTRQLLRATETFDEDRIRLRVADIMKKPEQVRWMQGLIESLFPAGLRQVGLLNDLAQFAAIETYPVEQITCPTLVIHGRQEGNVPFDHAEFVAENVPGAELYIVEGCGHLIWLSDHVDQARAMLVEFLGRDRGNPRTGTPAGTKSRTRD
jgi:pimeloyl-ACP methyl ester carboxylesterase